MICINCKDGWKLPEDHKSKHCPFCGKALFKVTDTDKNLTLHEVLYGIVQQFGPDTIGQSRLKGLLADTMPNVERRHLKLIGQALNDGVCAKLLDMTSDKPEVRVLKIDSMKQTFRATNALNLTADYVVDCLAYALGWIEYTPQEDVNTVQVNNLSILQQAITMAFSDDRLAKKEAEAIFSLAETLNIPEDEAIGIIIKNLKTHNCRPDRPIDKTLKSKKEIIISRDWLLQKVEKLEEEYESVKIGDQEWMKRNLDVSHFRNGDPISEVKIAEEWRKVGELGKPAWCYYENDPENGKNYGKLYNWFAVNDPRGLAPEGWHVPSDREWQKLINFVSSKGFPNEDIQNGAANALKSCRRENSPLKDYCDTMEHPYWRSNKLISFYYGFDAFGFSALPGGYRFKHGYFGSLGSYGIWWSSSKYSSKVVLGRSMVFNFGSIERIECPYAQGFSVRSLRI